MTRTHTHQKLTIILRKQMPLLLCCLLLTTACINREKQPEVSFYYWRTVFKLSDLERQTLLENDVKKLYIRYFDVDLDGQGNARPESPIYFAHRPEEMKVIPVIYIKNKVMLQKNVPLNKLAEQITSYIHRINKSVGIDECEEIQIDCDWTLQSRNRFMMFVDTLKQKSGKTLSATIRLHQVKHYKTTHIPNVDKAVLMYYNMGKIAPDSLNSIYDREIAKNYITSLDNYPLKLHIALPIFSWAIQIRGGKVIELISKTDRETFANDSNFIMQPSSNIIEVKNSNIKRKSYFLRNDRIKIEEISKRDILQMTKELSKQLKYRPEEIIFFDLDEFNIKKYNYEELFFKSLVDNF